MSPKKKILKRNFCFHRTPFAIQELLGLGADGAAAAPGGPKSESASAAPTTTTRHHDHSDEDDDDDEDLNDIKAGLASSVHQAAGSFAAAAAMAAANHYGTSHDASWAARNFMSSFSDQFGQSRLPPYFQGGL